MRWRLNRLPFPNHTWDYADGFSTENANKLPDGICTTHAIELEPGAKPPFGPIYHLSAAEVQVLRGIPCKKLGQGVDQEIQVPYGRFYHVCDQNRWRPAVVRRLSRAEEADSEEPSSFVTNRRMIDRLSGAAIYTKLDLAGCHGSDKVTSGRLRSVRVTATSNTWSRPLD